MSLDTFVAYVGVYNTVDDAEVDYEGVKALYYELDAMDTFDAAVIAKEADGKVKIVKKHEQPTRHGAWAGAGVGLAAGLVVALFPAVSIPLSIAVGTGGGAAIGAITGHVARGMSRSDLKDLGEQLDTGEVALVVVAATDVEARVDEVLRKAEKLEKKQLKADDKALKAELDAAQKDAKS